MLKKYTIYCRCWTSRACT